MQRSIGLSYFHAKEYKLYGLYNISAPFFGDLNFCPETKKPVLSLKANVFIACQSIFLSCHQFVTYFNSKELGCFHINFAQLLTDHNFCLTRITASILIYANALGYFLSIKVEFVMRNMISICLYCCI